MEMVLSTHEMDDGYTTGREAKAFQVSRLGQAGERKQTSLMVAGRGGRGRYLHAVSIHMYQP